MQTQISNNLTKLLQPEDALFPAIETMTPANQDTQTSGRPRSIGKKAIKEIQDKDDEVMIGENTIRLDFNDIPFTEEEVNKIDNSLISIDELVQQNGRYNMGANLVAAVSEQQNDESKLSSIKQATTLVDSQIFDEKRNSLEMDLDVSRITDKMGHVANSLKKIGKKNSLE